MEDKWTSGCEKRNILTGWMKVGASCYHYIVEVPGSARMRFFNFEIEHI